MKDGRKLRGRLLRLALNRPLAIAAGLLLAAPATCLLVWDYRWENQITDALGMICGATGTALLVAGVSGRRPDWIDPSG